MHLVTTSIENTWPEDNKTEILFLGEWCRLYLRKKRWETLNFSTLKYHWDDPKKLKKDFKYLEELYEQLIPIISQRLNTIHKVKYSLRYWRILVGPWFSNFIHIIYDRWFMLQSLDDVNSVLIVEQNEMELVPNDMSEFNNFIIEDRWNEFIFSFIIKKEKLVQRISYTKQNYETIEENKTNSFFKKNFYKLINIYNKIFTSNNKYFFISSYIPTWDLILINLKLKQLPAFIRTSSLPNVNSNLSYRGWSLLEDSKDKFIKILNHLIPLQMPKIYLEGYSKLKSEIKKTNWPLLPKVIFTANSYSSDDFFKAWAADKVEKSTKLIIAQHGGHFGMTPMESYAKHQYIISDKWISWGWKKKNISKIRAVGNIKIIRAENLKINSSGYCLIIGVEYPRLSYHLFSAPISTQYLLYLENQFSFLRELPQNIFDKILYKLYPTNYQWSTNQRLLDNFPKINIDFSGKGFKKLLKDSRICIVTYNGTSFLESFAWNFPTIIFFDSLLYELNKEAKASFEILKKVNIYHSNPESAATHLIKIWEDTKKWWYEPSTQFAIKEFSKTWNNLDGNIIKNLIREIK